MQNAFVGCFMVTFSSTPRNEMSETPVEGAAYVPHGRARHGQRFRCKEPIPTSAVHVAYGSLLLALPSGHRVPTLEPLTTPATHLPHRFLRNAK